MEELVKEINRSLNKTLILNLISKISMHGAEIANKLRQEYRVRIPPGTLYPILKELELRGFIKGSWEAQPKGGQQKRYIITPLGLKALHDVMLFLRDIVKKTSIANLHDMKDSIEKAIRNRKETSS
ncbi:MAG: PadR family transcriptional regulator [Nitrososphaerales archaeon]